MVFERTCISDVVWQNGVVSCRGEELSSKSELYQTRGAWTSPSPLACHSMPRSTFALNLYIANIHACPKCYQSRFAGPVSLPAKMFLPAEVRTSLTWQLQVGQTFVPHPRVRTNILFFSFPSFCKYPLPAAFCWIEVMGLKLCVLLIFYIGGWRDFKELRPHGRSCLIGQIPVKRFLLHVISLRARFPARTVGERVTGVSRDSSLYLVWFWQSVQLAREIRYILINKINLKVIIK